jgi:hypothetical protein
MQTTIRDAQLANDLGGWIPANETWTYASATTITVPSGAASKYQKGDKIKITNNSATKYFYIVGVADTVLTVTGGSDYTVHDSAITNPFFSKIENPQGFPHWFNWTETYTGFSADPTSDCIFKVSGNTVSIIIRGVTNGTSNATGFTISIPIQTTDEIDTFGCISGAVDAGANTGPQQAILQKSQTAIVMQKDSSSTGWTNSGNKRIIGLQMLYKMA